MTFKPLSIGPVQIGSPVVLAALAGYTDLAYRRICRKLGAPFCATEVMLDSSLLAGRKLRHRLAATAPDDEPLAGQLLGNDPDVMAEAAASLAPEEYQVIDLNFACPVRKAIRRKRGGFLMKRPEQVLDIIRRVKAAAPQPLTLKLRSSYSRDAGDRESFWQIARGAFDMGVAAICVHARSVEGLYGGSADWEFLAQVKAAFPDRVVIGSGDASSPAAALRMIEQTGVDGVAAARGALGNPWFFRQFADLAAGREPFRPTLAEQRTIMEEHYALACDLHGPVRGPKIMRKFGIKYARNHPHARELRVAFVAVKNTADWNAVLDRYYC
ncbi:MAG: tRNA-dihydrouridine synthase family protein [Planctomycetaceae bacterium]|nr:tRNA-dihydrouridine synthase family protein [Planctomycetaceae bacterium]